MSTSFDCPQGTDAGNSGLASHPALAPSLHSAAARLTSLGELCAERLRAGLPPDSLDFLVVLQGISEAEASRIEHERDAIMRHVRLGNPVSDMLYDAALQLRALVALIGVEFATSNAPEFLTIAQASLGRAAAMLLQAVHQVETAPEFLEAA